MVSRLGAEPTVLAPRRISGGFGRHWALPSMAMAAAVVSVTWMAVQTYQGGSAQPEVMPASHGIVPAVVVQTAIPFPGYSQSVHLPSQGATPAPIQFSAREFDAYLRAHQEFSPSTTLQGLSARFRS